MKTQAEKFWIVWCPTGAKPPSYRHTNFGSAAMEAERLAQANPGREFFVLGAEMSYCAIAMQRVEYFDGIPF
ncbi:MULTISPECIES: hypothetical protein [unclassified Paraburkholderia]|uniref:hypothetical protein n=1 Tax=unclassified Paraburkholderia TaxID=2615204 RepID=UPI00162168DF|nr:MULTISPECIES: hypothetical protein [unclassified Paraburkholderia]MBB5443276.1 hypothetical protein [Paraburkholderia sp. WSM4177]MBB5483118.1 hypothetical protein [Paraburkholderia sp. WSM4180]